jgi:hypothetical protein
MHQKAFPFSPTARSGCAGNSSVQWYSILKFPTNFSQNFHAFLWEERKEECFKNSIYLQTKWRIYCTCMRFFTFNFVLNSTHLIVWFLYKIIFKFKVKFSDISDFEPHSAYCARQKTGSCLDPELPGTNLGGGPGGADAGPGPPAQF